MMGLDPSEVASLVLRADAHSAILEAEVVMLPQISQETLEDFARMASDSKQFRVILSKV